MSYLKINNHYINSDVIAQYVGIATNECPGVVGMAMLSLKDGLYKLLKKESSKKGVEVILDYNELVLNLHIIVLYEVNIPNLAKEIKEKIKYSLKEYFGIEPKEINIYVEGIIIT